MPRPMWNKPFEGVRDANEFIDIAELWYLATGAALFALFCILGTYAYPHYRAERRARREEAEAPDDA